MEKRHEVIIAETIGAPIDPNLPVPFEISEIANVRTAKPSEIVYTFDYSDEDANADDIYSADANGKLTNHKVSPIAPALVTFSGLQSKLEYVLLNDIVPAVDQDALSRKKAGITRGMDKQEVKRILDAILALDGDSGRPECEVAQSSSADLYDLIIDMKQAVQDYATDYVLLVGSTVDNAIDTYEKENADNFYYNVTEGGLRAKLLALGITVIKVVGQVNSADILNTSTLILVGRNSKIQVGRPITFIRRQMSAEVAKMMNSESIDRAITVIPGVQIIHDTTNNNLLAWGVCGYESIIEVINNYRGIRWAVYS